MSPDYRRGLSGSAGRASSTRPRRCIGRCFRPTHKTSTRCSGWRPSRRSAATRSRRSASTSARCELEPRNAVAQAGLIAIIGQADPQMSETRLKQLIAREPSAFLYFSLGNLYARQTSGPAHRPPISRPIRLQPDNPDYAYNLAIGLEHLEPAEACAHVLPQGARTQLPEGPCELRSEPRDRTHRPARGPGRLTWHSRPKQAMAEQRKKLRLGELLIQQGLITADQLRIALTEQKNHQMPIGRLLVRLGFVTEAVIRDIMARTIGQESIDLNQVVVDADSLKLIPQDFARRHRVLPIAFDGNERSLTVAITEVFNVVALDQLRATLGQNVKIKTVLASEAQLEDSIDQFYGHELSVDGILREIETGEIDYQSLQVGGDEYTQPIVRLVGALLVDAVKRGSSDIHFEPEFAFLRIRYRIDGVLEQVRSLHKNYWPGIAVRVEGDQRHEHRRDTRTAGRPHLAQPQRPASGLPRGDAAHHPRREHRAARAGSGKVHHQPGSDETAQARAQHAEPDAGAPGRHPGHHRPDRQRQDHDAVLAAVAAQRRVRQHHDAGGPGRISR